MKVVLCGPPHSGKSCLRFGLKEAIKAIPGAPYPFVITACPDGEGSWFQETASKATELAATLKAAHKGTFSEAQARMFAQWVRDCSLPLTLVDTGGKADALNEHICAPATHAVIVTHDNALLTEWRDFCSKLSLRIIAELYSDYDGKEDGLLIRGDNGVYRGSVHHLERGDLSVQRRPTVLHLASIIVDLHVRGERWHGDI